MSRDLPERDWKLFRELRELALERLCRRILEELQSRIEDRSRTYHERYLDVLDVLKERDREIARAFDGPRRSRMLQQLGAIQALGLLEADELARFTAGTRDRIEARID